MGYLTNFIIFILGASIGSFLNVLIDRLPNGEPITGRSHCDHCKKKLSWLDLFPICSFILLKGKSRCCHKKLSWQYPLVEMITGLSFLLIFNSKFLIFNTLILWGITSSLIVIFFSDLKYHLISDYILIVLAIFSWLYHWQDISRLMFFLVSGAIVAFPIFLLYYLSKERAMGLGDVYLSAIIGFLLGWKEGFLALYIAFVTGAIFGLILIITRKKKIKSKIALGPFIVLGTVIMMFWGEKIFGIIEKIYGF